MQKQFEAQRVAHHLFSQADVDWVQFFKGVLGAEGIVRKMYPTPEAMAEFEKTEVYAEIQTMLAKLREKNKGKTVESDPTRVITVRLPRSLHEALRVEADEHHTSINQLCISKLLQYIDDDLVPSDVAPRDAKGAKAPAAMELEPAMSAPMGESPDA